MGVLQGAVFAQRFAALDALLTEYQPLWRNRPFVQQRLAWEDDYPQLAAWLRSRSLQHAEEHHLEPWRLQAPDPFPQWARLTGALSATDALPLLSVRKVPEVMQRGIPGRKWQQITAFAGCLPLHWQGSSWLDWCSGKGHLGRLLAWPDDCLCCIEQDPQLIAEGQLLSERWQLRAQHRQCDALSPAADRHLAASDSWAALHACGDLHTSLLRKAGQQAVRRLVVAPCCYNRISANAYQPLSRPGRASALKLDRSALGLPLQATVTAGAGEVKRRNRMMAWRLAFDGLQRTWRGVDEYLPVPSKVSRWPETCFSRWCTRVAALKQTDMQPVADWAAAERAGWELLAQVRNLELVQGLFRRPLELWLLCDMALWLQEQGFEVQLGEFCSTDLTPRNLMLLAERG